MSASSALGYVGLPLAVAFAHEGCEVIAVDLDTRKVAAIDAGESYIEDVPSEELREMGPRIRASTRYSRLAKADAVLICVPTPLTANREPEVDHGMVAQRARLVLDLRGITRSSAPAANVVRL